MSFKNCTLSLLLSCFLMIATGCASVIKNDTPAQIPQNGSEIYTLAMTVQPNGVDIINDSCSARVVIDGEIHKMKKNGLREFTYNYKRPVNKHKTNYYYELDYKARLKNQIKEKTERSKLYNLIIANRYAIGFESNRGIPGTSVVLLGRGFEEGDRVEIGGVVCETTLMSQNALSFVVPMLGHHGKYQARLISDNGDIGLGDFCIDQLAFRLNLEQIDLVCGEKQIIVIAIDSPAPDEGILVDITTNIPDSVVMEDIFIPAGARSATAVIQGGLPGSGMLYFEAGGFEELKIPVEIMSVGGNSDSSEAESVETVDEELLTL